MDADSIVVDSRVRHGKPVVKGTRVSVDIVLGSLASGMTPADVAREYGISQEAVLACLAYASRLVADEELGSLA